MCSGRRRHFPGKSVAEFLISERARQDLIDIYLFSSRTFGQYQAEAYHAGLERTFGLLADFPRIGTASDDLVAGYFRFRFQSHYVFYTIEPNHIFVRTRDPRPATTAASAIRLTCRCLGRGDCLDPNCQRQLTRAVPTPSARPAAPQSHRASASRWDNHQGQCR